MKKIITLLVFVVSALSSFATDYTDSLTVIVGNTIDRQTTTISVEKADGAYTLSLKNFTLLIAGGHIGVGTIVLEDIPEKTVNGVTFLKTSTNISITDGDDPSIPYWIGPTMGLIPIDLTATIEDGRLYAAINIDMRSSLNLMIPVTFGHGYQIANADFETSHAVSTDYEEPRSWHSFMSATGSLASFAGNHVFMSDKVRPGSMGSRSVLLTSSSIFGIVANGTITTGRLSADNVDPANTANNAFADTTKTDVDSNGDPFYTVLYSRPDSIAAWVKFKQGKVNADYPYASLSAVITDGTYYQDPEDKTYTNVAAKASDTKIETNNFEWQRIVVPFDYKTYAANNVKPKVILVTMSTNATPGKGSGSDSLYIDDVELLYNATLSGVTIKDKAIENFDPNTFSYDVTVSGTIKAEDVKCTTVGQGAYVMPEVMDLDGMQSLLITVTSNDLKQSNLYVIFLTDDGTGISTVNSNDSDAKTIGLYNLNGQRVNQIQPGQIYIKKLSNGKSVKFIAGAANK